MCSGGGNSPGRAVPLVKEDVGACVPSAREDCVVNSEAFGVCQERGSWFLAKEGKTCIFGTI